MSLPALLTHRITVTRQSFRTSDAGDNVKAGAYAATTITGAPCRASQVGGSLDAGQQRERSRASWVVVLDPTHDVYVRDRATVTVDDGATAVLDVTEVRRVTAPGRTHHVRLSCEEVTG